MKKLLLFCWTLYFGSIFADGVEVEWLGKGVKETKDFYETKGKCVFTATNDFGEREFRVNVSFDKEIEKFEEDKQWYEADSDENRLWFVSEFKKKLDTGKDVKLDFKIKWRKSEGAERPIGTCVLDDEEFESGSAPSLGDGFNVEWEAKGVKETRDFYEIKGTCVSTASEDFKERQFRVNVTFDKEIDKFYRGKYWDDVDSERGVWYLSEFNKKLGVGKSAKFDFKIKWRKSEGAGRPNVKCVPQPVSVSAAAFDEGEITAQIEWEGSIREKKKDFEAKAICRYTFNQTYEANVFQVNVSFTDKEVYKFSSDDDWIRVEEDQGTWYLVQYTQNITAGDELTLKFKAKYQKYTGRDLPNGECTANIDTTTEAPSTDSPTDAPISQAPIVVVPDTVLVWDDILIPVFDEVVENVESPTEPAPTQPAPTSTPEPDCGVEVIYRKQWTLSEAGDQASDGGCLYLNFTSLVNFGDFYINLTFDRPTTGLNDYNTMERVDSDPDGYWYFSKSIYIFNPNQQWNYKFTVEWPGGDRPLATCRTSEYCDDVAPPEEEDGIIQASPPDCGVEANVNAVWPVFNTGGLASTQGCQLQFTEFTNFGELFINVTFDRPTTAFNDYGNTMRLETDPNGLWYYSQSIYPFNANQQWDYNFQVDYDGSETPTGTCLTNLNCESS